jgi:SulP family sulfate permease
MRSDNLPAMPPFLHRTWPWLADVNAPSLRADATAALLAAVLVLPQAIAFAALAGLPTSWGLLTAAVPCVVAALAGSSRHVLTGPTNAMSLALAASLAPLAATGSAEYLRLALVVTLFIGVVQVGVALLRLGVLAHFIAPSVLLGFTTGAAVLIAWHALKGLSGWPTPSPWALGLGLFTLGLALGLRWLWPRAPSLLLALVAGTLAGAAATAWGGASLLRIGALPQTWPHWQMPMVTLDDVPQLATIALALTIVALGQSVAIAKALAARSGQVLDVNRECLGQGLANMTGPFFSCFAACGSLNRSVPHLDAGARTPLAGVMAAALLLVGVAVAAPLLAWVPMAAIDALLLLVAWSLVDRVQWRELWLLDRREAGVAVGTLAATLLLPMEVAVLSGVAASLVVYLHRTAHPALRVMGFSTPPAAATAAGTVRPFVVLPPGAPQCPQLTLLRMEGSVYFGAVAHVADALQALREQQPPARHLLVMAKSMNFIDHAGAGLWELERRRRVEMGGGLYFHRPRPEVVLTWQRSGFIARLGAEHLFADKRSAIAAIVPKLDGDICAGCRARVFDECAGQPRPVLAPPPSSPGSA